MALSLLLLLVVVDERKELLLLLLLRRRRLSFSRSRCSMHPSPHSLLLVLLLFVFLLRSFFFSFPASASASVASASAAFARLQHRRRLWHAKTPSPTKTIKERRILKRRTFALSLCALFYCCYSSSREHRARTFRGIGMRRRFGNSPTNNTLHEYESITPPHEQQNGRPKKRFSCRRCSERYRRY